jgi:hypothetical protein
MSMSLLQHNISGGMAKLCQEMGKKMVEITTQMVEGKEMHANDTLNHSDDEETIVDRDELLDHDKPLIKSEIEVERKKPQQSLEELKKARIKEIKEWRITLKVFRGNWKSLSPKSLNFRDNFS